MADYDVVVVGAGPAGSMTAKWAAKGGARVLMIEKRQEVGSPVRCGEGISTSWLESVGIKLDSKSFAREVKGARIVAPNGTPFILDAAHAGDEVGIVIDRIFFDKLLAHDAVKVGVDLQLKTSAVDVIKEGDKVKGVKLSSFGKTWDVSCGAVVAADGFESNVARWAGMDTKLAPRDITSCFQYRLTNINHDPNYCEFILGSKAPGGYIWIFPKNDDTANVGIGMQLSKLKDPADVKKYLDKFIQGDPRLRKGKALEMVSGAVSICAPIEKTVGSGILLVGDAARMIDPITGGGISNSCKAGKIAGDVLARASRERDFSERSLLRYEKGWRDKLENNLYRNWLAKEKLVTLPDDTFNKVIATLNEVGVEKMSTFAILKAIEKKYPDLVKEFQEFL